MTEKKCKCGGVAVLDRYCGAYVCMTCGNHLGLCACYCGWKAGGGDGRAYLIDAGETIDEEV